MIMVAFVLMVPLHIHAAYSYTIKLYSGNHGTFADGSTVKVYTVSDSGEALTAGKTVTLNYSDIVLNAEDGGKYYVRGVRESGKDNDTVSASAVTVNSDREYVVAYGIAGDMVSYTVNYVDRSGNALAASETYYGVVGDKPVVAYLYVDGYLPQAYNLTKTLSSDATQNVFTFTYTAKPTPTETVIDEGTRVVPSNPRTPTNPSTPSNNNGTTTDGNNGGATSDNDNDTTDNTTDNNATDNEQTVDNDTTDNNNANNGSNTDENGVQDIEDLDDNETPLDNPTVDDSSDTKNMLVSIGAGVVAIVVVGGLVYFIFKKKKKNNNEA